MTPVPETPRLLLVEDDPTSRAFLLAALEALPARVDTAGDCATASAMAHRTAYALWLIDAHLPDGDGAGLLAELRRHAPDCPALAHTASQQATVHASLRDAGFAAVLVKPLSASQLQAATRQVLGQDARRPISATVDNSTDAKPLPVWDDDTALSALHGRQADVNALRRLFREELPAIRATVHATARDGDHKALHAALHRLVASCGFVGAAQLGEAVSDLRRQSDPASHLQRFDNAVDTILAQA